MSKILFLLLMMNIFSCASEPVKHKAVQVWENKRSDTTYFYPIIEHSEIKDTTYELTDTKAGTSRKCPIGYAFIGQVGSRIMCKRKELVSVKAPKKCKHTWVEEYSNTVNTFTKVVCIKCHKKEQRNPIVIPEGATPFFSDEMQRHIETHPILPYDIKTN